MSRHTPGPWGFGRTGDEQRMILGNAGKGRYVCSVQIHQMPRSMGLCDEPEREANASLIAAAPDLLEACKTFAEWLRREDEGPVYPEGTGRDTPGNEDIWREWYDENFRICGLSMEQARAAIAKATGVQP